MEEERTRHHQSWIKWVAFILVTVSAIAIALLFLIPKPLVVEGTLKTDKGPVPAGAYDFRLKFYNATTRTDLVYSYDAKGVHVDDTGNFTTTLPSGDALNIATLMQVCVASPQEATPGTITGGRAMLPSCDIPQDTAASSETTFNQTICGLTTVDQNPTNTLSWLATKNIVYATPTKACGQMGEIASTISDEDLIAPLIETPGSLSDILGGITLQAGTILTVDADGQIVALPPTEIVDEAIREEIAKNEAENPPQQITQVFNSYPTTITGETNTDNQTLELSGSVLSISGGNSVTLPSGGGPEQDGVIGNEILDTTPGSGLVRVGTGTTLDPFRIGLITCTNGAVIKSTGAGTWGCATDTDTDTTYTAGTGISFSSTTINNTGVLSLVLPSGGGLTNTGSGQNISLKLQDCANGEILQYNVTTWSCVAPGGASPYSFSITDNTTSQPVLNNDTITFVGNEGLLATVAATDSVTYGIVNGGVTTIKLADGAVSSLKIADGAVTTIDLDNGAVTNSKLANNSLTVTAGAGLSGGGVVALGASTTLNIQACANNQILKHNGTTWVCAADSGEINTDNQTLSILANAPDGANTISYDLSISGGNTVSFNDRDTLYTAITSGGLALNGTAFSLQTCPAGQLLKSTDGSTPTYACAADTDTNTTYSAGTGLSLVGTTFNNTGVLSVSGSGAITSSGGQNPNIAFANGSATGQFWQWNGTSWELAMLPAEQDAIVGNEVTNATGSNSGLLRSGTGTSLDPYTLAVSVGNGLQLTGGNVAINSPTCAGTTKLQWTGTAFTCVSDVDTDTTNFSITDGSTSQNVGAGQAITFSGDAATKVTATLGGTRNISFRLDTTGASNGQVLTVSGSGLAWQTPDTAAPVSCSISGTYFCQGGNTYGTTATLGTNDAQPLAFETGNAVQMTILANGNVGIGTSPSEKLDVNGNINIPSTSSTVGVIKQNGIRLIHTKDDASNSSLFAGLNSGNLTNVGFDNVGVGSNALAALTDGFYNTAVGSGALTVNTDGIYNTAVGALSMEANTTGYYNSGLGERTLYSNVDGFNNTAVGGDALFDNTSGSDNTGLGVGALGSNTTGTFNVGIGSGAGTTSIFDADNTTGSNNVFIGHDSGLSTSTQRNNSTAIGAFSVVNQSDSLILGCITGVNGCTNRTRIGIGTATPQNMLHIDGGSGAVTTMMQFTNATTGQTTSDGFNLGIDSNGTSFFQQREAGAMVWYTNGGLRMVLDSTGRVGISQNNPGYLLHVGSSATTAGTAVARFESASGTCTVTPVSGMACTSDEREKKNISDYDGALDIINQIDVKEYNMKTDKDGSTKQIGVIAQKVEKLLPSLVMTDPDGAKSFSYAGLTPVLLQAIKEQQVEIENIKLGIWNGGLITKDTKFKTAVAFDGPARFTGKADFTNDVAIAGKVKLSQDQVNQAVIPKGSRQIAVTFGGAYPKPPYITATPREFVVGAYRVTDVKRTGFVIELEQTQQNDVRFDWHAFGNNK